MRRIKTALAMPALALGIIFLIVAGTEAVFDGSPREWAMLGTALLVIGWLSHLLKVKTRAE